MDLAVNYSQALVELIQKGDVPADRIEFNAWTPPEQIRAYRQDLPDWPFLFHASEQIYAFSSRPVDAPRLCAYLDCTDTPWISVHLTFLSRFRAFLAYRGLRLPDRPARFYAQRFVAKARALAEQMPLPVIIENMGLAPQANPAWINDVLSETGFNLLLDLGHARVAADHAGMDEREYIGQLPLERVVQVHVSGSRMRNGRRFDAHEPLLEEDYALLDWVLERTQPQILTLEYYRQREPLAEQLARLDRIVHGRSS